MALLIPPVPVGTPETNVHQWKDWFKKLQQSLVTTGAISWSSLNFTASNITDILNRAHNNLQSIQGGSAGEYQHLTTAQHTSLIGGGDTTLHYHATDRARANHTGTQLLSTISDVSITSTNLNILDDGVSTTLHYHDSDRARANHTGTQLLATISDVSITATNLNTLDDGVSTTLHYHSSDRDRANHTGTQLASTISDFQTAVSLNNDVRSTQVLLWLSM